MKIHNPNITGSLVLSGSAGTSVNFTSADKGVSGSFSGSFEGSLKNVKTIDATTESTIESSIDTLANLTSIQGNTVTLGGNLVTQNNNVTINAAGAARTLTLNESLTVGDGHDGTLTYSAASKTLTVEDTTNLNQDLTSDASPTFAAGTITGDLSVGGTLTAQEVHTEFESASILFTSGSTRFGDDTTDTHRVTGSMDISGSLKLPHGDVTITDNLSVDGTSNLDNTDIDGTLTVDGGNIVFNEDSADQDFRVESNGNTHMLFVDGGNNRVGVGTDSPSKLFHTEGSIGGDFLARFKNVNSSNGEALGLLTNNTSAISRLLHAENSNGRVFTIYNDAKVLIGNGSQESFTASSASLHIVSNEPSIRLQDMNHAPGTFCLINANSGAGGLEIIADGNNKNAGSSIDFQVDGGSKMVISGSGNVGIGTSSPDAKLKVEEDTHGANVDIKMRAQNDSGAGRTFAITADPDARSLTMGEVGEFVLISDGSNDVLSMGSSTLINRVGQPLAVTSGGGSNRGGIAINSFLADTNGPLIDFNRSRNNTIGQHTSVNSGDGLGAFIFRGSDGDEYVDSAAIVAEVDGSPGNNDMPGRLQFYTTPDGTNSLVERMRITNAGRVGINTTSPDALLHVSGSQGSGHVALFQRKEGANNTSYMVSIENDDTTSNQGAGLNVRAGNDSGDVTFNAVTRDGSYGMRILGDGRVGVGLSDPEATLQVNTGVSDATIAAIDVGIGVEFNGGSGGHVGMAVIDGSAGRGKNRGFIGFRGNSASSMGHSHIVFGTGPGVADDPVEIMRITTAGTVLMGTGHTITDGGRLQVNGGGAGGAYVATFDNSGDADNANGIQIRAGNSSNSGTTRFVNFQESDGDAVGGVRTDSGNVQLYNTSDKRLKKNIRPNEWNGLDIINKSKLYDFEWIKSGETHRGGWIAQEMLDVWEDVVVKPDEQDEHYHIATSYFVPMLVKAVQELSEKNDALEKRIEELEK